MKKLALVLFTAITLSVVFSGCGSFGRSTVNINDYILPEEELTYSGYNGYAYLVTSKIDILDLESLIIALNPNNADIQTYLNVARYIVVEDITESDSESSGLSNGDELVYRVTVNCEGIEALGLENKLESEEEFEVRYTIKGLEEVAAFDPFQLIESAIVELSVDESQGYPDSVEFILTDERKSFEANGETYYVQKDSYSPFEVLNASEEFLFTYVVDLADITNETIGDTAEFEMRLTQGDPTNSGLTAETTTKEIPIIVYSLLEDASKVSASELERIAASELEKISGEYPEAHFVDAYLFVADDPDALFVTPNCLYTLFKVNDGYVYTIQREVKCGTDGLILEGTSYYPYYERINLTSDNIDEEFINAVGASYGSVTKIEP